MENEIRSFGGNMELPQFVVDEAKALIAQGVKLPAVIEGSAEFFVAEGSDASIQTFGGFEEKGTVYKIGTKK